MANDSVKTYAVICPECKELTEIGKVILSENHTIQDLHSNIEKLSGSVQAATCPNGHGFNWLATDAIYIKSRDIPIESSF